MTVDLIEQRAWAALLVKVNDGQRQALLAWAAIMKRVTATGKNAPLLLQEARRLMEKARGAVPVWIMPFSRVTNSFHPVRDRFDVIIVDEASQEGVLVLAPFYMARKVIVVGDDEQVWALARMRKGKIIKGTTALLLCKVFTDLRCKTVAD